MRLKSFFQGRDSGTVDGVQLAFGLSGCAAHANETTKIVRTRGLSSPTKTAACRTEPPFYACTEYPPSTGIAVPVMKSDAALDRKTAIPADVLLQNRVGLRPFAQRTIPPGVIPAGEDLQRFT